MVESCVKSNEETKKIAGKQARRLAQLFLDYYLFFVPFHFHDLPACLPANSPGRESEELCEKARPVVVSRCSIRPSWAVRVVGGTA